MPKINGDGKARSGKLVNRQAVGTYRGKLHQRQSGAYGAGHAVAGERTDHGKRAGAKPGKNGQGDKPAPINRVAPSLKGLLVDIDSLTPDPQNARLHPERNLEAIKESLREFGQRKPISVVKRGGQLVVMAGNGTLEAAKALGWTRIAAAVDDDLSEADALAYGLADNRTAELARWDFETVAKLDRLIAEGRGVMVGWSADELAVMRSDKRIHGKLEVVEDDPEPISGQLLEKWKVEPGQVWVAGQHRLVCGDARDRSVIKLALDGTPPTCVFTDPPYGVAIGDKNKMLNTFQRAGRCLTNLKADTLSPNDLKKHLVPVFQNVRLESAEDCSIFVTAPQGGELGMMIMVMGDAGLPVKHVLIWKKNAPTFSMGRLDYDYQHEPILFTWKKKHKRRSGGEHQTSIWEIPKPRASAEHPTMKPVALVVNAILNHTDPGDTVLDVFLGSGTTLVAAEQTGRCGVGIEIDPGYCAVTLERLQKMGLEVTRTGR